METIGLIGGMSWESTVHYYQNINLRVRQRLGGLHSARSILYSVDFHDIEQLQRQGLWQEAGMQLAQAARSLQDAGADLLVLCTNTMHLVAPAIRAAVNIPLLQIADPTAAAIQQAGLRCVALLGTRFTMEQRFYTGHLEDTHGLKVLVPDNAGRQQVHDIIYQELCLGIVRDESRQIYRQIIQSLVDQGAQGIILGCTEIAMLVSARDASVPLFDTAALHAQGAVDFALADEIMAPATGIEPVTAP